MSKIIVLMGAPGAGKGTQARLLQERQGFPQVSTGDIFRAMKQEKTPLAEEIRLIMDSGKLVPDELTMRLVRDRTSDFAAGYILDGYPRTPTQAAMLERLAEEQSRTILPIFIDVPLSALVARITGRRSCPVCGEIYNIHSKPPKSDNVCDFHPDSELIQRSDDSAEQAKARFQTYEEQTRPLLDYYSESGRLRRVDGTMDPGAIYSEVESLVTSN